MRKSVFLLIVGLVLVGVLVATVLTILGRQPVASETISAPAVDEVETLSQAQSIGSPNLSSFSLVSGGVNDDWRGLTDQEVQTAQDVLEIMDIINTETDYERANLDDEMKAALDAEEEFDWADVDLSNISYG